MTSKSSIISALLLSASPQAFETTSRIRYQEGISSGGQDSQIAVIGPNAQG